MIKIICFLYVAAFSPAIDSVYLHECVEPSTYKEVLRKDISRIK